MPLSKSMSFTATRNFFWTFSFVANQLLWVAARYCVNFKVRFFDLSKSLSVTFSNIPKIGNWTLTLRLSTVDFFLCKYSSKSICNLLKLEHLWALRLALGFSKKRREEGFESVVFEWGVHFHHNGENILLSSKAFHRDFKEYTLYKEDASLWSHLYS